mmetsp:Transcript_14099/g.33847  ORF Transcript_14099/g.33847 Transcript_14099/m.33847 type:complete len:252 (-) Transcript_14099:1793-2548(-)
MASSFFSTSGFSTGSSERRMLLYVTTIRSRLPVCWRSVSLRWYVLAALSGTSTSSSRKYFTSRSRRTSMGSKLTRSRPSMSPPSSLASRDCLRRSSDVDSLSLTHLSMVSRSYSSSAAVSCVYSLLISLLSSVSITSLFKPRSFSMGSLMRSTRPRTQYTAPACGGLFLLSTGSAFWLVKISCTSLRSMPYWRISSICFFSRSVLMISRSSSPSNESSSLNAVPTVTQSSNAWMMTLPRRRSSSLMTQRNS